MIPRRSPFNRRLPLTAVILVVALATGPLAALAQQTFPFQASTPMPYSLYPASAYDPVGKGGFDLGATPFLWRNVYMQNIAGQGTGQVGLLSTGNFNYILSWGAGPSPGNTMLSFPAVSGTSDTFVMANASQILTNKTLVASALTLTSLTASQFVSTTGGAPITVPGDLVIPCTRYPMIGPGFMAITFRGRPGTNPGTSKITVIAGAGSGSTEVTLVDNLPGGGC